MYIFRLRETDTARLDIGGKAASLGAMLRMRLPVPDGYVIAAQAIKDGRLCSAAKAELDALIPTLRARSYAVRSSAVGEDGDTDSFTAVYLTGTSKIYMKLINGIDYDDADTIEVVRNDNIPTMIIVSDRDEVCLPDQVEAVYDNIACGERAVMHVNSEHIMGVIDDPEGYMEGVTEFLTSAGL